MLPTVLELAGIEPPDVIDHVPQSSIDGVSFAYLLGPDGASAPERHETQHFEMFGSRALYHKGWKLVSYHPVGPLYDDGLDPYAPFEDDVWELYHVAEDLSETEDLAADHPELVAELDGPLVGGGRTQPGPAHRQPGAVDPHAPQARPAAAPGHRPLLPGRGPGARAGRRQRPQPRPTR